MAQHMHFSLTQVSTVHAQMLAWCLDASGQHIKHVSTNFRVTMHSGVFQWSCNLKSKISIV